MCFCWSHKKNLTNREVEPFFREEPSRHGGQCHQCGPCHCCNPRLGFYPWCSQRRFFLLRICTLSLSVSSVFFFFFLCKTFGHFEFSIEFESLKFDCLLRKKLFLLLSFGSNKCEVLILVEFHHMGICALCLIAVNLLSSYVFMGFGQLGLLNLIPCYGLGI